MHYAGHNYIGTEHILLGLLREGEGVAARVLETLGADPSKIRTQVISFAWQPVMIRSAHECRPERAHSGLIRWQTSSAMLHWLCICMRLAS